MQKNLETAQVSQVREAIIKSSETIEDLKVTAK
jgi:hypothetical protein